MVIASQTGDSATCPFGIEHGISEVEALEHGRKEGEQGYAIAEDEDGINPDNALELLCDEEVLNLVVCVMVHILTQINGNFRTKRLQPNDRDTWPATDLSRDDPSCVPVAVTTLHKCSKMFNEQFQAMEVHREDEMLAGFGRFAWFAMRKSIIYLINWYVFLPPAAFAKYVPLRPSINQDNKSKRKQQGTKRGKKDRKMIEDGINREGLILCPGFTDRLMVRDPTRCTPRNAQSPPGLDRRRYWRKVSRD